MSLTEFLLARIGEDESAAQMAVNSERPGTQWRWEAPEGVTNIDLQWLRTNEEFATTSGMGPLPAFPLGYEALIEPTSAMMHIARWDPARVLAECEAKRRIVTLWQFAPPAWDNSPLRDVLLMLAQPYADHPDFDSSWRF